MPASSRTHLVHCARWATLAMCASMTLGIATAAAQEAPLELPAPEALDALLVTLRADLEPARASRKMRAERCELDAAAWRCVCGQLDARWSYAQLILHVDGRAELAQLRDNAGRWHIERLELSSDGWHARGLWWRADTRSGWLRVEVAAPLELEALSWRGAAPDARHEALCYQSAPAAMTTIATASRASARRGHWQLEALSVSWLRLADPVEADARRDGLLPPTLRANGDGFEYSHGVGLESLPLIPLVLASPRRWYGLGASLESDVPTDRALEVSGVWSHEDGFGYGLFGQALWGQAAGAQLSMDMEQSSTPARRELRQLEQGTWLRQWQSARVGLGLSTESASLWGAWSADSNPWLGPGQQIAVGLGDAVKLGASSHVELSAQHAMRYGEGLATQQRSDLFAGWRTGWGSRRRMYLELGTHGDLSLETSGGEERWRTDIAGRVVAHTSAGLTFAGRMDGWTHLIHPTIIGMFSPAALERRGAMGAAAVLSQQLRADDGSWQLEAPLGLWVDQRDDRESGARWMPYGELRARWSAEEWEARVEGLVMCLSGCAWRRGMAVAKLKPRRDGLGAQLWHGAMEPALMDWAAQLQLATGGLFGVRAQQRFIDEPLTAATPRISGAGLSWQQRRHTVGMTGWHTTQVQGLWGGYTFTLGELGWRLGAHGSWSSDGRWASWIGLTL